MLTSTEVRKKFLDFFAGKGHEVVPSSSLIPANDPTLLFTNAGMVQFKDLFSGKEAASYARAVSSQKCLRAGGKHNDLENVGFTARHHTFFEMLGNFSFGDYFKEKAIQYAWDFIINHLQLDPDRLMISVFGGDEETPEDSEAYRIWHEVVGVPANHILKLGRKDNFWSMGDTGPCGPCSEIHYLRDQAYQEFKKTGVMEVTEETEDQYLEFWNLVFMEFERHEDGSLTPLPAQSIDTGMGLERVTSILQGKPTNYDTDAFTSIIGKVSALSGQTYGANEHADVCMKVIADHARATTFLISDGIIPGSDGRSYVLRRIMRRAIRYGSKLGFQDNFFHNICLQVIEAMSSAYPELQDSKGMVAEVVQAEEASFRKTLERGIGLLEKEIASCQEAKSTVLPGLVCFELYDTYGFPLDLTEVVCKEHGLGIDSKGFEVAMEEQRARGREQDSFQGQSGDDKAVYHSVHTEVGDTEFYGYEELTSDVTVRSVISGGSVVAEATANEVVELVFDRTCAYGESGGQVGDTGELTAEGVQVSVLDVQKPVPGLFVHRCKIDSGTVKAGDTLTLRVDTGRKENIKSHHSATHLLHHALREVLGTHVQQKGSLVEPERLRFDFSHFKAIASQDLQQIEQQVNQLIRANHPVVTREVTMEEAKAAGAMALFGEKYGSKVRMVEIGPSLELCGGNHVEASGAIGQFKITSEQGVATGVRRIEAVSGAIADRETKKWQDLLFQVAGMFRCSIDEVPGRIEKMQQQTREMQRTIDDLKVKVAQSGGSGNLMDKTVHVNGIKLLATTVAIDDTKALRQLSDQLRDKIQSGVVVLGTYANDKVTILASVTSDLKGKVHAGNLIKKLAPMVGGKGGGRPDFAQGGGSDGSQLEHAIQTAASLLEEQVS